MRNQFALRVDAELAFLERALADGQAHEDAKEIGIRKILPGAGVPVVEQRRNFFLQQMPVIPLGFITHTLILQVEADEADGERRHEFSY